MAATKTRLALPFAARAPHPRALRRVRDLLVLPWPRRAAIALGVLLYAGIWGWAGSPTFNDTDFDIFFLPSARIALAGHPLHIYQVRFGSAGYPNANGPLSILPLTLVAWLAQHLGWLDSHELRRALTFAVFSVFPLLLGREALLAVDRLLRSPLSGVWRPLAFAVFIFSPELWHTVLGYGHIEHPIMLWLVLASVRTLVTGRSGRAGILMGLALLTRSATLLYLIPLVLVLLVRGHTQGGWRTGLRFGGVAALTALGGLLPFLLADMQNVLYSMVTFRTRLVVGGGTIWGVIAGHPAVELFARQHDSLVIVGAAVVLTLITLALRRDLDIASRDLYVLLALSGLCFPLFIKTLWPYYYFEEYVLLAVWWLGGAGEALSTVRTRLFWLLAILVPGATVGVAEFVETMLSAPGFTTTGWTPHLSLQAAIATVALALIVAALLWGSALPWRYSPLGQATGAATAGTRRMSSPARPLERMQR